MRAEVIDEKECARRLNEAREEVAQLGATIQGYKTRIATLEAENRELKKSLKVFKRLHEADAAAFDEALDGTE